MDSVLAFLDQWLSNVMISCQGDRIRIVERERIKCTDYIIPSDTRIQEVGPGTRISNKQSYRWAPLLDQYERTVAGNVLVVSFPGVPLWEAVLGPPLGLLVSTAKGTRGISWRQHLSVGVSHRDHFQEVNESFLQPPHTLWCGVPCQARQREHTRGINSVKSNGIHKSQACCLLP